MVVGNATVLLTPGDSATLGTVSGSALISIAAWDGTTTLSLVIEGGPYGNYGYVVDAVNDIVAADMVLDAADVHIGITTVPVLGGTYYLATSNDLIGPNSPLTNPVYVSEDFALVPEPGSSGMILGFGLMGIFFLELYRRRPSIGRFLGPP